MPCSSQFEKQSVPAWRSADVWPRGIVRRRVATRRLRGDRFRVSFLIISVKSPGWDRCATHREDGEVMTREATAYRDRAATHGFDPKLLFRTFTAPDGRRFKLIGLGNNPRLDLGLLSCSFPGDFAAIHCLTDSPRRKAKSTFDEG